MVTKKLQKRLLRVSTAKKIDICKFKEGVSLQADFSLPINNLIETAIRDRMALAILHRKEANNVFKHKPPLYRCAIARYYYAMYHAFRAVSFYANQGDDHQEHSDLPKYIPDDFPHVSSWKNDLKNARLTRNKADYEPYPKNNNAWKNDAVDMKKKADNSIEEIKIYFSGKGIRLI